MILYRQRLGGECHVHVDVVTTCTLIGIAGSAVCLTPTNRSAAGTCRDVDARDNALDTTIAGTKISTAPSGIQVDVRTACSTIQVATKTRVSRDSGIGSTIKGNRVLEVGRSNDVGNVARLWISRSARLVG